MTPSHCSTRHVQTYIHTARAGRVEVYFQLMMEEGDLVFLLLTRENPLSRRDPHHFRQTMQEPRCTPSQLPQQWELPVLSVSSVHKICAIARFIPQSLEVLLKEMAVFSNSSGQLLLCRAVEMKWERCTAAGFQHTYIHAPSSGLSHSTWHIVLRAKGSDSNLSTSGIRTKTHHFCFLSATLRTNINICCQVCSKLDVYTVNVFMFCCCSYFMTLDGTAVTAGQKRLCWRRMRRMERRNDTLAVIS